MVSQIREPRTADTAPTGVAIAAHDLRKAYQVGQQSLEILHGISLSVSSGELVAVMRGKSYRLKGRAVVELD